MNVTHSQHRPAPRWESNRTAYRNGAFRRLALLLLFSIHSAFAYAADLVAVDQTAGYQATAEWHHAQTILMHTPGEELFLGVLHPEAALFESPFGIDDARKEHQAYIATLKQEGVARVVTLEELLLEGTEDPNSQARRDLIALANQAVTLDLSGLKEADQALQRRAWERVMQAGTPRVLVRTILQRPTITLRYDTHATGEHYNLAADYALSPVMNLYYMRDQMITTKRGVVLGRMARPQRAIETQIASFVLAKLGVPLLHRIHEGGILEGGDFLPAGNRAFIGVGLRTNDEAVKELLENDAFGTDEVVVVKDLWQNQQEMHLDTYFNLLDSDLAVLVADRYNCVDKPEKCLMADVWTKGPDGRYELTAPRADFVDLLRNTWKFRIIPVSVEDQHAYGINFLTLSTRKIVGVDGVSHGYKQALANAGVTATWIDFTHMKQGYGAAHCTTQVLQRIPQ